MAPSEQHIARVITALSWVVVVGLLVLLSARFLLSTGLAHHIVEDQLTKTAKNELNAELLIGNISGDAWKGLVFEHISMKGEGMELAIDRIELRYVFIELLLGDVQLRGLTIEGVESEFNLSAFYDANSNAISQPEQGAETGIIINQIQVAHANVTVNSSEFLPDSTLTIRNLTYAGNLELGSRQRIGIYDLDFSIDYGQLPNELLVGFDGVISDEAISLNDLVFGMGGSALKGALRTDFVSDSVSGKIVSNKVLIDDFISAFPTDFDMSEHEIEVALEGTFQDFGITVAVDGDNLEAFTVSLGVKWDDQPILHSFSVFGEYLNLQNEQDSLFLKGGPIEIDAKGLVHSFDANTELNWMAEISNLELNQHNFQNIQSTGELQEGDVTGSVDIEHDSGTRLQSALEVQRLFSTHPNWQVDYFIQKLNPIKFDEELSSGLINASGRIQGNSFSLPDSSVQISMENKHPETGELLSWIYGDDTIDEVRIAASLSAYQLIMDGFARISDSKFELEVQVIEPLISNSEYTYQANFYNVDIGDFSMFEGNTTNITGGMYGIGNGITLENANVFGSLSIEQAQINNANIESFNATVQYDEGIFKIQEGTLVSEIATGAVSGQRDIRDVSNPENFLNLELALKNLQPLAGLFGLEILEANGELSGIVQLDQSGELKGDFDLNLTQVMVDSLFSAQSILGTSTLLIEENRYFDTNLEIVNPIIQELIFQDITLEANGFYSEDSLQSNFELMVIGSDRGRMIQQGTLQKDINLKITDIQFTRFDFISSESDLLLQKPFNIRFVNTDFGTDTLNLAANNGAFLEFAIPYSSENEAQAFISGDSFDIGLTQDIVFGERFIDGVLSGELNYHQTPGDVLGNGLARLDNVEYKGAKADSLIFSFDIINERLDAKGNAFWDGELAATGWANVPFVLNKIELDDEFYGRPVRGNLEVRPTNLTKFSQLLEELGIENSTGIASINGTMSGEAGTPQFSGTIEVADPELSGIPVDRLTAEFNYSNAIKKLIIQSEIFAKNTPIAELNIAYPLNYDFRTLELYLPDEGDELEIKAVTNNLDIALFNDFVDPNYIASLKGELNADLQFTGELGNIEPKGFLNLQRASMAIPYSGITLKNMAMQIDVDASTLSINRMYAESGRGRITASGQSNLEGISPTDIKLDVSATSFELAKTRDMNLVIDLNALVAGSTFQPKLSGDVKVKRGFYMLSNFGEEAIEEITLEDEEISSFSPFDSLAIELKIDFQRDFFVRSRDFLDLEMEPVGSLDILKEKKSELQVFGTLTVDDGYIRPLGKQFDVNTGSFTFLGDMENPELDFQSSYVPQVRQKGEAVTLFYNIGGTRYEPTFMFEGDPVMEESDVICYTLFNKPCYSLDSWQSVFAEGNNAQAFQALTDVLLDEVETLATRQLGVDVVQIDNSGQNGRTAITTGWYLNERTFFSIINELTNSTPKTLFVLEYLLNENWDLIITQGDDARQGVDVRYQFDY